MQKQHDLDEWFVRIAKKADIAESSAIQGCTVFKSYGLELWNQITSFLDDRLHKQGYTNAYFPLFVPTEEMKKHKEHYEGFSKELVSLEGKDLHLRPTSEMIIYPTIRNWIQTDNDLPLKINQFCSVVRWESVKPNLPLIRDNEFLWQESHTLHTTAAAAEQEATIMLALYRELIEDYLAIPVFEGNKPPHRLFPGAEYTLALESIMPNGKSLQMATSHFLAQKFSRPLELTYTAAGQTKFPWQSCHGLTTRVIGALIMVHGDDHGLVIPPKIAPIQVACNNLPQSTLDSLRQSGIRIATDVKDPILKGIPLMMKQDGSGFSITRRDTLEIIHTTTPNIPGLLDDVQRSLKRKAQAFKDTLETPARYEDMQSAPKGSFFRAPWCGEIPCAKAIRTEAGVSLRVISSGTGNCIRCTKPASHQAIFAQAY